MYLAILGYLLIAVMMFGLLKGKFTPLVAFSLLPPVFALLAGFNLIEISDFIAKGVSGTLNATALAMFATVYFRIMTEEGLFDPIVDFLSKKAGGNVIAIMIITSLISGVAHMDTGTTSTILVTIPAMLPLYKKFNIKIEYLFLIMAQSVAVVNLLPHGGGSVRMSSVTGIEISTIFRNILPVIGCMLVYNLLTAVLYGKKEQKRIASGNLVDYGKTTNKSLEIREVKITWRYWVNLILTVLLLVMMFLDMVKGYFVFMVGLAIAIIVNYPQKDYNKSLKDYAADAFPIGAVMLASGVLVGVMGQSGMLTEMASLIVSLIPTAFKGFFGVIVGYLSLPLSFCLGADGFYYGLTPLFTEVGNVYGFSTLSIISIMMFARDAFGMITPVSPVNHLAPGLLGKDLNVFIKFCAKYLLLFFTVEIALCVLFGILPLVA